MDAHGLVLVEYPPGSCNAEQYANDKNPQHGSVMQPAEASLPPACQSCRDIKFNCMIRENQTGE